MDARYKKALSRFKYLESLVAITCKENNDLVYNTNISKEKKKFYFELKELNKHLIK